MVVATEANEQSEYPDLIVSSICFSHKGWHIESSGSTAHTGAAGDRSDMGWYAYCTTLPFAAGNTRELLEVHKHDEMSAWRREWMPWCQRHLPVCTSLYSTSLKKNWPCNRKKNKTGRLQRCFAPNSSSGTVTSPYTGEQTA